jgi:hypothetical protein
MPLRSKLETVRGFLERSLFAAPRPATPGFERWEKAALASAFLGLGIVAQLARIGWTGSLESLWAEDGPIFVQDALSQGFLHAVSSEYAGYLVVVPRLIAEVATLAPLGDVPALVSILSAAFVALSGLVVWHASAGHITSVYLRGALAVATVLTPVGGLETIDASAYVSWPMLFACFWLLLWRPRTNRGAALGAVFIALTALSNPGVWFLAPLAVLRAVAIRDRRDLTIVGAYFAASCVQLLALARSSYEAIEPVWTADIWTVLLQRVVDGSVFGLRLGGFGWEHFGWPFLIVLSACVALALIYGFVRATAKGRVFTAIAVPLALALFVISVYQRAVGEPMLWPAHAYFGAAGRYSIVPVLLLISVAMMLVEHHSRAARRSRPWAVGAVLTLTMVSVAVSFPAGDTAARGTPTWDAALDVAAGECARGATTVSIPVSPPGFAVQVACADVPASAEPVGRR